MRLTSKFGNRFNYRTTGIMIAKELKLCQKPIHQHRSGIFPEDPEISRSARTRIVAKRLTWDAKAVPSCLINVNSVLCVTVCKRKPVNFISVCITLVQLDCGVKQRPLGGYGFRLFHNVGGV